MNALLQWLASDGWAHVLQALLHTLWLGALLALVVLLVLRRISDPFLRYRWCMGGLGAVLLGGVLVWAVLDAPLHAARTSSTAAMTKAPQHQTEFPRGGGGNEPLPAQAGTGPNAPDLRAPQKVPPPNNWRSWLVLLWLAGAAGMLARAARSVGAAEQLRRSAQPLTDARVLELLRQTRRRLALTRRIAVAVTNKLTSPAVIGIVRPTLLLPLSLLTALSPSHLELVLLHELAHIRRGDYLANLCQFLVESLLFFNPAVWWLSRQARLEREACCDALATSLAEDPVEYARALAQVAEQSLEPAPAPAPAFADRRSPASLKDRIRRLLVPGYRSTPRLTWKALAGWVLTGGTVLLLSAMGTQWTLVAAARLLTPEQRIASIEATMKQVGQSPNDFIDHPERKVEIQARLWTAEGAPLRQRGYATFYSTLHNHSYGTTVAVDAEGRCRARLPVGDLYFAAAVPGYAPACLGPLDICGSNEVAGLQLVLKPGFPVTLVVVDADSGAPLPEANLSCQFWMRCGGDTIGNAEQLTTDERGQATLEHCAGLPLAVTVTKPGYETREQRFESPNQRQTTLKITTRRALLTAGTVTDRVTQQPLAGAELHMLRANAAPGFLSFSPDRPGKPLATTDAQGRFQIDQLPRGGQFWLLVRAADHADAILSPVQAGQTNLHVALGPELLVRGHFKGDTRLLGQNKGRLRIDFRNTYQAGNHSYGTLGYAPVHFESGEARFEFVSPIAGPVWVNVGDRVFTRDVKAPIKDWVIDLTPKTNAGLMRTVTLRFVHSSGVPPKGTVAVDLPDQEPNAAVRKELEIQHGEVSFKIPVGRHFSYEPAHTIGYWFPPQYGVTVSNGPGPLRLDIPVVPAGAILAQARQADGVLASDVSFSVHELKRSPLARTGWPTTPSGDSWSADGPPRHYVATPLPLEGTYLVFASQANHFAVSAPIKLTAAAPEKKVELQFRRGEAIEGRVLSPSGQPVAHAAVELTWTYQEAEFRVPTRLTDENGRFRFKDCDPDLGQYSLLVRTPGIRSIRQEVNFHKLPLTLRLEPGLTLSGRVVEQ